MEDDAPHSASAEAVDEDDDAIASDVDEDDLLASTAPTQPKPLPPSSSSSSSTPLTALGRLNLLLQQTEQFSAYVKPTTTSSEANGGSSRGEKSKRSHLDAKEKEEDAELVEDELEEEAHTQPHVTRLLTQPSCVVGEMRDYQLEALNWLIRLHEQKINGILADEMGLGTAHPSHRHTPLHLPTPSYHHPIPSHSTLTSSSLSPYFLV